MVSFPNSISFPTYFLNKVLAHHGGFQSATGCSGSYWKGLSYYRGELRTWRSTNYLGHVLLTQLLMPKLLSTAARPNTDVRIVSMSSIGHRRIYPEAGIVFGELKSDMKRHGGPTLYGQSMIAKALFSAGLAKRYPQITSTSLHPGGVKTNIWAGAKDVNWFPYHLVIKPMVAVTAVSAEEGIKT
jgi:NAD(P)-dependent dehydrogenase (short-subunit alcohol dehydrogenase family)